MTNYDLAQPVPGPRIVPFGVQRLATDVLPNGRLAFRVTQRFADVNPAFPQNGAHGAIDLGNFFCGDPVLALHDGEARTVGPDRYQALGVIIDHDGWSSLYWHLQGFSIPRGDAVPVKRGQQIGIVGKTGLGAVCHLHLEVTVAGVKVDPEPYLFGAPLVIEDDVNLPAKRTAYAKGTVQAKARLREGPSTDAKVTQLLEFPTTFDVILPSVEGGPYSLDGVTRTDWAMIARAEVHFVARPLLSNITPTEQGKALLPPVSGDTLALEAKLKRAGETFDAIRDAAVAGRVVVG